MKLKFKEELPFDKLELSNEQIINKWRKQSYLKYFYHKLKIIEFEKNS